MFSRSPRLIVLASFVFLVGCGEGPRKFTETPEIKSKLAQEHEAFVKNGNKPPSSTQGSSTPAAHGKK
jgi:hypothetical protein